MAESSFLKLIVSDVASLALYFHLVLLSLLFCCLRFSLSDQFLFFTTLQLKNHLILLHSGGEVSLIIIVVDVCGEFPMVVVGVAGDRGIRSCFKVIDYRQTSNVTSIFNLVNWEIRLGGLQILSLGKDGICAISGSNFAPHRGKRWCSSCFPIRVTMIMFFIHPMMMTIMRRWSYL